jgi:hypothetical protein
MEALIFKFAPEAKVLILPLHRPLAVSRKGVHVDYV